MRTYDNNDDCVVIADEIVAETAKAVKCRFGDEEVWLPTSQADFSGTMGDENIAVILPFWLAEKNGLEDFIRD